MAPLDGLSVVFFDIGNTLGVVVGGILEPFDPGTRQLLSVMKGVLGLRLGVITNLPLEMSTQQVVDLLEAAGLLTYLDPAAIITNHDAGADKPSPAIYRYAAERAGVAIDRCMFIGEDPSEIDGARRAGMAAIQKPFPARPPA